MLTLYLSENGVIITQILKPKPESNTLRSASKQPEKKRISRYIAGVSKYILCELIF